jgi:hypothetical protein
MVSALSHQQQQEAAAAAGGRRQSHRGGCPEVLIAYTLNQLISVNVTPVAMIPHLAVAETAATVYVLFAA